MEERRKSKRVEMSLPAQLETTSGVHRAVVLNGSAGGCFVQVEVEEPGDEPVRIGIQLPREGWVYLWGEVAYHLPTRGLGLQFTEPAAEAQPMLEKWLRHVSSSTERAA